MRRAQHLAAIACMAAAPALLLIPALSLPGARTDARLHAPWPQVVVRPDNPTTAARIALGRILFFEPVISNSSTISCAHCHHPDLGFSDGLVRARGYGGEGAGNRRRDGALLPRHTPTLWNSAYSIGQYWDGRASDLEDQARIPITKLDEMKSDPDTVVAKLKALSDYAPLFDRAFGGKNGSEITFQNVVNAIAAFERTLVTRNSRYDRFAAGETNALTASEQRGLNLFLSSRTHCADCHTPPTFGGRGYRCTGVPDVPGLPPDPHNRAAGPGRGGGPNSAFKIPTLRNVALHPPYMHNGSIGTLGDVIDFYVRGGGRGRGLDLSNQDPLVAGFTISATEKADLIAFLRALTDTSAMPAIPKEVPSGLPVVERLDSRSGAKAQRKGL